jgi:hypothetical protein
VAPRAGAPGAGAPGDGASRAAAPCLAAPGNAAPDAGAPGDAALGDVAPGDVPPGDGAPRAAALGDAPPEDAPPGDGSVATDAALSCRTSAARNTGTSSMRLATTAIAATDDAAAHKECARRPTIPTRAKRCRQERTTLAAKTKVPTPVFVVVFNMLSWAVRPLHGCRESALPPGADRGLEAGTVNSIRRVGSPAGLPPIGRRFCVVFHCVA